MMNNPALYAEAYSLKIHGGRSIAEEFAEELGQFSGRCIDIGSGPGDALVEFILPKLNPKSTIVCSDISEDMVNFAKDIHGGNERLSFLKLDIETRRLPTDLMEQFDHATSLYCLHWCRDMRQVFENIFNLLRPGGTALLNFVASTPVFAGYNDLATMSRYQLYTKDSDRFIPVFQDAEGRSDTLERIVKDAGFHVVHLSERQMIQIFDSQDTLSNFLVSLNPFIVRMPADLREEYRKDLVKEFVKNDHVFQEHNGENDYKTLFNYRVFIVHLRKPSCD